MGFWCGLRRFWGRRDGRCVRVWSLRSALRFSVLCFFCSGVLFFCDFRVFFGGYPLRDHLFRPKGAGGPPGRPRDRFLTIFGGFRAPFWGPGRSFSVLSGNFFSVVFGYGSGDAFRRILARFWRVFRCNFGRFLEIPGFCDFIAPVKRNHRFWGSEGVRFGTFSVTFSGLDSGPHVRTFFVDFGTSGASILGSRGPLFRHLFFSVFSAGFRVPPGAPAGRQT